MFRLSSVHEVFISSTDNNEIQWKKLSSDDIYVNAKITVGRITKPKKKNTISVDEVTDC